MPTVAVNLDVDNYVQVNVEFNPLLLQAHRDAVRITISELKPLKSNTVFHVLGGDDAPLALNSIDTNVWALATTDNSSLIVSETKPFLINDHGADLAEGKISGRSVIFTPANNAIVGDIEVDIWDESGDFPYDDLSTPQSLELVSDDADDTLSGTGARTISFEGLDGNWDRDIQLIEMDGVTPVALTGTHRRPRRIVVTGVGSTGKNQGTISLRIVGGATICTAKPNNNRSFLSQLTIPADHIGLVRRFLITTAKGRDATCKLRFRVGDNAFSSGTPLNAYENHLPREFPIPLMFPEKTDIKFTGISTDVSNTTNVSVTYDVELAYSPNQA